MRTGKTSIGISLILFVLISILISSCGASTVPEVVIPDQSAKQHETLKVDLSGFVSDSKSDLLFSLEQGPGRIVGSVYELTPGSDLSGRVRVSIRLRDKKGNDGSSTFFVNVAQVKASVAEGHELGFAVPEQYAEVGDVVRIGLNGFRVTGEELRFEIVEANASLNARIEDGILTLNPADGAVGQEKVIVRASAGEESVEFEVPYLVRKRNISPTLNVGDQRVVEGGTLNVDLTLGARDVDGSIVSYSLVSGPGKVSREGIFTLEVPVGSIGTHTVAVEVLDDRGGTGRASFNIVVMPGESADRRTLSVGGDNSLYSTIQSAIDQAADGDLILIQPGSYKENLVVNKAVEIRGVSRDEVILEAANITTPAILVRTGTGFVISNITVKTASSGIQVSRVSGEIRNCDIVGGRYGIAFSGSDSSDLLVSNCRISSYDALTTGDVPPTRNVGIYAYGSGVVRIEESIFERNGTAVHVSNDIVFRVALSEFESNRIAITVGSNSSGSFVGNSVTRSIENGVLLNTTGHVELINNEIFANVRHGLDLYLRECTDCGCGGTVFRGTISGSGNILDQVASICPASFAWPEDFYTLDESLGKPQ